MRTPLRALLLLALLLGACGGDDGGSTAAGDSAAGATTTSSAPADAAATIALAKTPLGSVVVDADGHTLYLFTKDTPAASACAGACAQTWPAATADGAPTAGKGLDGSKLATAAAADGRPQVTYGGHRLYRYAPDKKAGDVGGQGIGGVWFVVGADGDAMTAAADAGTPSY
jgi:predicted lipoprotein with Yx(FWY)xxD motif